MEMLVIIGISGLGLVGVGIWYAVVSNVLGGIVVAAIGLVVLAVVAGAVQICSAVDRASAKVSGEIAGRHGTFKVRFRGLEPFRGPLRTLRSILPENRAHSSSDLGNCIDAAGNGEVLESLEDEAKQLLSWLERRYPQITRPTARTVMHNIRDNFRSYWRAKEALTDKQFEQIFTHNVKRYRRVVWDLEFERLVSRSSRSLTVSVSPGRSCRPVVKSEICEIGACS